MSAPKDLKPFPTFKTDEEAEKFVDEADLSEYDFSQFVPVHFEFAKKSERVNMRFPKALLTAVKDTASQEGIPYQRFIRQALEHAVTARKKTAQR
jgi:predicted DNA binding CopG/RHH family protein